MWVRERGRERGQGRQEVWPKAPFFLKVHIRNTWNQKDLAYLSVRTLWIATQKKVAPQTLLPLVSCLCWFSNYAAYFHLIKQKTTFGFLSLRLESEETLKRTHAQEIFPFLKGNTLFGQIQSKKKNQNCQFKLKVGTQTNSNWQNSMVVFTFFVLDGKYPFWANLIQKIRIVSLT